MRNAAEELQRQIDELSAIVAELKTQERPAYVARYKTSTAQSIPNVTATIVQYNTKEYDPYNCVTTGASWAYTARAAGYYAVSAAVLFGQTNTWADGESAFLQIFKNGTLFTSFIYDNTHGVAGLVYFHVGGTSIVYLAENDCIDIRAFQGSGGALTLQNDATYNHVAIWRIG